MKASSLWHKQLADIEDKEGFKSKLIGSRDVLERLAVILQEKYDASLVESEKVTKYDMASWSEYQADQIGTRRTLKFVIDLITLTEE